MKIDKETLLFISASSNPGNFGNTVYNMAFNYYGINAIYKSFKVKSISNLITSIKELNIKGCGVSMPFKKEVIKHGDFLDEIVLKSNSANTILNTDGKINLFNTDHYALKIILEKMDIQNNSISIFGKGALSSTLQNILKEKNIYFTLYDRSNFLSLMSMRNGIIFNCTPKFFAPDKSNLFIDCRVDSETGTEIAYLQASKQFEIYTGLAFPWSIYDRTKIIC